MKTNKQKIVEKIFETAAKSEGNPAEADLKKVRNLDLRDCQLTDVSTLGEHTQLEKLWLGNNQISDVSALGELTQLKVLYLSRNRVTSLSKLVSLTKLESLYLRHNPNLTIKEIANLRKALPKCKIWHDAKK